MLTSHCESRSRCANVADLTAPLRHPQAQKAALARQAAARDAAAASKPKPVDPAIAAAARQAAAAEQLAKKEAAAAEAKAKQEAQAAQNKASSYAEKQCRFRWPAGRRGPSVCVGRGWPKVAWDSLWHDLELEEASKALAGL